MDNNIFNPEQNKENIEKKETDINTVADQTATDPVSNSDLQNATPQTVSTNGGSGQESGVENPDSTSGEAVDYKEYEFSDNGQQQTTQRTGVDAGFYSASSSNVGKDFYNPEPIMSSANQAQNPPVQQTPNAYGNNSYVKTNPYANNAKNKNVKFAGRGFVVLMFCLSISLSLILGAVAGALVAGGINIFEGIVSPTVDNVKSEAIVQINPSKIDYGATVNATELAYNSVVTINVFADEEMASENKSSGAGSGVIYTKDGYILTCHHVVEGFDIIKVTLANGDYYYADVVGADSQTDIAVIKVKATELSACVVRDWKEYPITIGESAIVIGNPLGVLGHSVTSGIISGLSRNITVDGQSMTLLQTDASINAGNSGGGIFDINGSLIGIVNAKTTGSTIDNLGFAVPIDTVYDIAKELIENGYVTGRPGLNLGTVEVNTSNYISVLRSYPALEKYVVKEYTKLPFGYTQINEIYTGLFVVDASTVKYAENTANNFKFGDKIVQVVNADGNVSEIVDLQSLSNVIQSQKIGDELQFTIYREGSYLTVTVVLVEQMS